MSTAFTFLPSQWWPTFITLHMYKHMYKNRFIYCRLHYVNRCSLSAACPLTRKITCQNNLSCCLSAQWLLVVLSQFTHGSDLVLVGCLPLLWPNLEKRRHHALVCWICNGWQVAFEIQEVHMSGYQMEHTASILINLWNPILHCLILSWKAKDNLYNHKKASCRV